ncbi:hypothetical protein ACQ4PT_060787 [Festuca glaucescens]
MAEMEDALRSCMEQLLIAREEREQIIVEAANEISSQQKKVRDLQHSLEVANKKAAKLAAENNSLCKAIDAKDKLARELRESKAASDEQLAGATAKLEAAQKQGASLHYEARMLQKELEVRSQEREYDLKSVDAARVQHAESLKKIAVLEGECQRLRAMVRKRLPGPAALAKMRDEVEQQQPSRAGASPRRQRSATPPMSPRSVMPMSPRSVTPRRAPDLPDQSHAVRLRAIEDENNALKRVLATRDTELQFARMKFADEACKLSAVQGQLKEQTEESKRLTDANAKTESWASALVSELDHFRTGKQGHGASSAIVSEMSLLDDFAEIEKLEMASADHQTSRQNKVDSGSVVSEKNDRFPDQNGGVSNGHPEWVQDVWELVKRKHEASGESIDAILEEIRRALDQSPDHTKGKASDELHDRAKVEKMVSNLVENINAMIRVSAEDNAAKCGSYLHDKSELLARLEYLVHVCHDVLHEKAKLEIFIDEVCLVLEYIASQFFSNQVRPKDDNTKSFDGDGSSSTVNTNGEHDMQSATSTATLDIQTEAHQEPIQSAGQPVDKVQERQLNEELAIVLDYDMEPGRKSSYYKIESFTDDGTENSAQEGKQLATNSEISAAADKLAECQETITNLSKQLRALQTPPNSGILDISMFSPRPSSADYKPQSLGSILADEGTSPPTPKQVHAKKEQGDPDAAARRSMAQEQVVDADGEASAQAVVQPVILEPRRDETPSDPRKKKRGPSLLGRMIFRKRVEGSSS